MALDPTVIIDRLRLKRRLKFWRIVALISIVGAILVTIGRLSESRFGNQIARLDVSGIILRDTARNDAIRAVANDDSVKALVVTIDSPGGTFVGGEALYNNLRTVAAKKPVVAIMGGTATSAAYMAAIGADYIVARNGTLTGSIGVIMQTADITGLLEKLGIKPETMKSGSLKAQPNPMEPFSPAAREAMQTVIRDLYNIFVNMIMERRGLEHDKVRALADGRVFTGHQAKANGLIDVIGAEGQARQWLADSHGVGTDLKIEDVEIKNNYNPWLRMISSIAEKTLFSERLRLDGVLSLWHPEIK